MMFHSIPFAVQSTLAIRAIKQRARLIEQMRLFRLANTKCFDPKDRPLVEAAVSRWFTEGEREGSARPTEVDAASIERFEMSVREGTARDMILASIGQQAGLLQLRDVAVAFSVVWIPTGFDFFVSDESMMDPLFPLLLILILLMIPFVQASAFLLHAVSMQAITRHLNPPGWLLNSLAFLVLNILLLGLTVLASVSIISGCGRMCLAF